MIEGRAGLLDRYSVGEGVFDFDRRGSPWHEDGRLRGDTKCPRRVRHSLRVISCGRRHDPFRTKDWVKMTEIVECTGEFVRTGLLQALQFQPDITAELP